MRRNNRVKQKDNGFIIYAGAILFITIVALISVLIYLGNNKNKTINIAEVDESTQNIGEAEIVSTEMGKTVEEQEKNMNVSKPEENVTETSTPNNNTLENNPTSKPVEIEKTVEENNTVETTAQESKTEENTEKVNEDEQINETKKEITFVKPTEGEIIFEFAKDNLVYSKTLQEWITHKGIDIKTEKTSVIKSVADGIVTSIKTDPRYGLTVVIEHSDGYRTIYSNLLTAEFVVEGEEVTQGQTIGTAGNTAVFESEEECHLHFELLKDGEYLDPTIYLK